MKRRWRKRKGRRGVKYKGGYDRREKMQGK
jgi:hypothetical protein